MLENSQTVNTVNHTSAAPKNTDQSFMDGYDSVETDDLQVPFIYFFKDAIKAGLISNIGQVEKLKIQNEIYSKYLDRWMSDAIKNKVITIKRDGNFTYNNENGFKFWKHNSLDSFKVLEPISNSITKNALKDLGKESNKKGFSSVNVFAVYDSPETNKKLKTLVNNFYNEVMEISKNDLRAEGHTKVKYVTVSTCNVDMEVLSEI